MHKEVGMGRRRVKVVCPYCGKTQGMWIARSFMARAMEKCTSVNGVMLM